MAFSSTAIGEHPPFFYTSVAVHNEMSTGIVISGMDIFRISGGIRIQDHPARWIRKRTGNCIGTYGLVGDRIVQNLPISHAITFSVRVT